MVQENIKRILRSKIHSNSIKLKGGINKMEQNEEIDYFNPTDLTFDTEVITEKEKRSRTGRTTGYNRLVISQLSQGIIDKLKGTDESDKIVLRQPLSVLWEAIRLQKDGKMPVNWKSHLKNELLLDINRLGFPIVKEKTASMQKGVKIDFNNDTDRLEIRKQAWNFE